MRVRYFARSCTDVCAQAWNAAFGGLDGAVDVVSRSPAGIVAMTSSVVGVEHVERAVA